MALTKEKLEYASHRPSHVESRMIEPYHGRMPNFLFWILLLFLCPQLATAERVSEGMETGVDLFGMFCFTALALVLSTFFLLGR